MDADAETRGVAQNDAPESVSHAASAWIGSIRQLLTDFIELAGLEAQRAGKALAWIIGLAAAAVVCLFAVWGLLSAAGAMWMVQSGMGWPLALALTGLANVLLALILLLVIRRLARRLSFPTVRRILGSADDESKVTGTQNPS